VLVLARLYFELLRGTERLDVSLLGDWKGWMLFVAPASRRRISAAVKAHQIAGGTPPQNRP
jgi:hypothetical protein